MKNRILIAILALCAAAAFTACSGGSSSHGPANNTCGAKDIAVNISVKSGNPCNSNFTLKANVTGAEVGSVDGYQWFLGGVAIEGATGSTIGPIDKNDEGPYTVTVVVTPVESDSQCTRTSEAWTSDCGEVPV